MPFDPNPSLLIITPGFGDLCNGPPPNVRGDHNAQGPILFPKFQEPIPESSPSAQAPIPVLEGNTGVRRRSVNHLRLASVGSHVMGHEILLIREHQ